MTTSGRVKRQRAGNRARIGPPAWSLRAILQRRLSSSSFSPSRTQRRGDDVGIEIPLKVRRALGLDDAPSWVLVSDHNVDEWPNAGLTVVPGRSDVWSYGFIPPGLFAQIKARFLELANQDRSAGVRR